jgi:all-trans-8'-apo-beta-carotenal 15,15'-oxygenase
VLVKDTAGSPVAQVSVSHPDGGYRYFHDFFWAGRYVVFHLHPAILSPLPMLVGQRSFADSLSWRPERGSLLLVVDLAGEQPPRLIESQAVWMWHALNAYTVGETIVGDFIGYDAPDHFLGPDAAVRAIMDGREGVARARGTLRRFVIDLATPGVRMETVADGHFEFPILPAARTGYRHRYGYAAIGRPEQGWYHDGVARLDTERGSWSAFHFDADHYVGEPVFAPDPAASAGAFEDRGWLLCEVLDGGRQTTFLAVFDAARIEDGPQARVWLRGPLPLSFHGWWQAA